MANIQTIIDNLKLLGQNFTNNFLDGKRVNGN